MLAGVILSKKTRSRDAIEAGGVQAQSRQSPAKTPCTQVG